MTQAEREFNRISAEYYWGSTWNRPGLERRDRSLIVLSMMIALNREAEFRLHIRAAHTNGVTREELKELLLQAAIYCGVPAANGAACPSCSNSPRGPWSSRASCSPDWK